jgi:FkbM family methyltransferase
MKRFLKQNFNRFLPDVARVSLKRRLAAKFSEPVGINLVVDETESSLRCTIDNSCSFSVPLSFKNDLMHYTDSSDGRAEFYCIVKAAKTGGILFDIGAHSGLISALFCSVNSANRVVSFEPSPILLERLSAIRQLNRFDERMRIEQIGIGETKQTVEMLLDPAGGFIQTQRFDHTMWVAPQVASIQVERIQDAASRLNVIPQFIKLDIEGYEYEAIKGAAEFLSRYKPAIFLELHLNYLDQRRLSPRVVVETLKQCGYSFYSCSGSHVTARELYDSPLHNVHFVAR